MRYDLLRMIIELVILIITALLGFYILTEFRNEHLEQEKIKIQKKVVLFI